MFGRELEIAKEAAISAGKYLRENALVKIDSEIGKDIKLAVDRESEKIVMEILSKTNISILSEEYGMVDKGTELCWIVDPLDGTMNYFRGMRDLTCISIALYKDKQPILGIIYRYMTDELFEGVVGERALLNGKAITCSDNTLISKSVLGTGFPVRTSYDDESLNSFIRSIKSFKKVRMLGTAAIMAVYVACGYLDVYVEENVMIWDVAAAAAIVMAAGGVSELQIKEENKCVCRCFANTKLKNEYENSISQK